MNFPERFHLFIKDQYLSQRQFAKKVGYNPQALSKFISGAIANPGSNLVIATIEHYPNLNLYWLLKGEGEMYRDTSGKGDIAVTEGLEIKENDAGSDFQYLGKMGGEDSPFSILLNSLHTKDSLINMLEEKVKNLELKINKLESE